MNEAQIAGLIGMCIVLVLAYIVWYLIDHDINIFKK